MLENRAKKEYPTEDMGYWVRGPAPKWDSDEGIVSRSILTWCSSVTERIWKGIISGATLAVTEGLVGKFL